MSYVFHERPCLRTSGQRPVGWQLSCWRTCYRNLRTWVKSPSTVRSGRREPVPWIVLSALHTCRSICAPTGIIHLQLLVNKVQHNKVRHLMLISGPHTCIHRYMAIHMYTYICISLPPHTQVEKNNKNKICLKRQKWEIEWISVKTKPLTWQPKKVGELAGDLSKD